MDPEILSIRLAEEAKRWDEMVIRLEDYLVKHNDEKIAKKNSKSDSIK
jgi:hypothetical protein